MNVFDRIIARHVATETTLGNPLADPSARERRLNYFAQMTDGRGFRNPPKTPRTDAQGRTRGDRKRLRAASARQAEIDRRLQLEASA